MIRRRFGTRSQVLDPSVTDQTKPYTPQNLSVVLRDWKIITDSYPQVAAKVFMKYITDYPIYRRMFRGLDEAEDDELVTNKVFMDHAYAIMNSIDTVLRSLTGDYEDDGELLPVIGRSHKKRGITLKMFKDLKDAIFSVCFQHLKSDRKSRAAWTEIINFIFENYICIAYKPNK